LAKGGSWRKNGNEEAHYSLAHLRDLGEEKELMRREDEGLEYLGTLLRGWHTREKVLAT
jgi:hypothetical protein